jgi:pimeloyl-ACP methyl ester carboxylesterase
MADDTIAVMDALDIDRAHIVGASMGGMIAQIIAAEYPERTRTLVSIMSTTGAPHLPPPSAESSNQIQDLADSDGENDQVKEMQSIGFHPEAIPRQLMAIMKTGDRSDRVATITVPTLVLHGEDDTLLPPEHGKHTAELIKNSEIQVFAGMGHNLPAPVLPDILARMTQYIAKH